MPDIAALLPKADPRIEVFRGGPVAGEARCVLLWVQRAQRATGNLAANLAVDLGDALGLPVVAGFCMAPTFPRATLRAYHFMAEGLVELPDAFAARGVGWALRVGEPAAEIPALARGLGAALVVTDQNPLRIGRAWRADAAQALAVPLVAVDADVAVPAALFPKEEFAARTIRPKLLRVLGDHLRPIPTTRARRRSDHRDGPDPLALLDGGTIRASREVGPVSGFPGGATAASATLRRFLAERLRGYATNRDRAHEDLTSRLGPYLHYGQIGPIEVALAVRAAGEGGIPAEDVDAFLNEAVVQRELSVNFALRDPDYDRYAGLPEWGRKTLAEHAADPRPETYTARQLDRAETGDRLWNAAQRQMVAEGFMPNRLRMYWAKQVVRWSETPEAAFEVLVEMNDRYFLCGRDAAGYANIAWAVGGRHDRPFPPNKPILGLVRPMGLGAMKRTCDIDAYIRNVERRHG